MKLNHKNLEIIEKWLETNELNFSSETIRNLYHSEKVYVQSPIALTVIEQR